MQHPSNKKGNMLNLEGNAKKAMDKILGLRTLNKMNPTVLAKAEKKVLQNLNLEDLATVAAAIKEVDDLKQRATCLQEVLKGLISNRPDAEIQAELGSRFTKEELDKAFSTICTANEILARHREVGQ